MFFKIPLKTGIKKCQTKILLDNQYPMVHAICSEP